MIKSAIIIFQLFLFTLSAPTPYYGITTENFEEDWVYQELSPLVTKLSEKTGIGERWVLHRLFGELHFEYRCNKNWDYTSCWSSLVCIGNPNIPIREGLLLHELGHRLINDTGKTGTELSSYSLGYYKEDTYIHISGYNPNTNKYERTMLGFEYYQNNQDMTYQEDYADMFMNWALGSFPDTLEGNMREEFIENFITQILESKNRVLTNEHKCGNIIDIIR